MTMDLLKQLEPPLPSRGPGCPSPQQLEELSAGDPLPPGTNDHVKACADCASYLEALRAEQDVFYAAQPPELHVRKMLRRASKPPRSIWRLVLAGAPLVALLASVPSMLSKPTSSVQLKGSGSFAIVYKRPDMA